MPRQKPHFKVRTSVMNHEDMAEVWADNRLLATWVRLGILAIERFADRTADSFLVSDRELPMITGVGRLDVARTSLERLADVSPISASREGDVWRIGFANLSKVQGFGFRNGSQTGPHPYSTPNPTPSVADTPSEANLERRTPPTPEASASSDPEAPERPKPKPYAERSADDYPPEVARLCRVFLDARTRCFPGLKPPTRTSSRRWLRDMDRLLRLGPPGDGAQPVSTDAVEWLIAYLFDPESESEVAQFWQTNVKSVAKLREHWEEIILKINHERSWHERKRRQKRTESRDDVLRRANERSAKRRARSEGGAASARSAAREATDTQ